MKPEQNILSSPVKSIFLNLSLPIAWRYHA